MLYLQVATIPWFVVESAVAGLLPMLLLLFLVLAVALWALSLFLQGWLYSEPVSQAYWRAPAAALGATLFIAAWCGLDYRSPGHYGALMDFSTSETEQFDRFWSVKKNQETLFTRKKTPQNRDEYRDANGKLWTRSDTDGAVEALVVENKEHEKIVFQTKLSSDGKFTNLPGEPVRYEEVGGKRVMTDEYPGRVTVRHPSRILANLLLNFLLLAVLFGGLWLLLRFQWSHAFGLALVAWLILIFFLPTLFKKTEDLARQKPPSEPTAASVP
jgi:hypothetical protein